MLSLWEIKSPIVRHIERERDANIFFLVSRVNEQVLQSKSEHFLLTIKSSSNSTYNNIIPVK